MEPLIIFVASKEEADLLIDSRLYNKENVYIVITGFGVGNVLQAIKEYGPDATVINIGFVGTSNELTIHKLYNINTSLLGPNENNLNKPIVLNTIEDLPHIPCITVNDFETNPSRFYPKTCYTEDYVVDMELYILANYFNNVYAFKIPSDTGDLKEYYSQGKYKDKLNNLRGNIYSRIIDILSDLYDN